MNSANQSKEQARSQPITAKYRLDFSQSEKQMYRLLLSQLGQSTGLDSANKRKAQVRSQPIRAKYSLAFSPSEQGIG